MTLERINASDNSTYHAMELAGLVALRLTAVVLGLTRTELAEVLGCLWYNILV